MAKKKLATVWLGGCSGCHMSLLDMDERILDVAALADIVKCPVVDGKDLPDVDITLVEGAVASDEHEAEIRHIRKKSKYVVALGDCAVTTNVTGLRNFKSVEEVFDTAYKASPYTDGLGEVPDHPALLRLTQKVVPLQEIVPIDVVIPGCPPSADAIFYVVFELLHDRMPDLKAAQKLKYG